MRIRKRIIAFLLSVLMVISLLPVQAWAEEYTLILYKNYDERDVDIFDKKVCSSYKLPKLEREGFTHTKWCSIRDSKIATDGDKTYEIGETVSLTGDLTLFAQWENLTKKITLKPNEPNGGTGKDVNVNVTKGEKYILPTIEQCGFANEGFYFLGWTKSKDGDVAYKPGDKITINKDTTLYAVWGCKVTLNPNGSTGDEKTYYVRKGSEYVLPTKEQCGFVYDRFGLKWTTDLDLGSIYGPGDKVKISNDTTFYATWANACLDDIPPSDGGYIYFAGIRWRVIGQNAKATDALLISAEVLDGYKLWEDAKQYCETLFDGNTAFTAKEKPSVKFTTQKDRDIVEIILGKKYTYQRVDLKGSRLFLLSCYEANNYFKNDNDRMPGNWWLRSPYNGTSHPQAGCVDEYGPISRDSLSQSQSGARPAFVLDLQSVLFTSAATDGKYSDPVDGSSFGTFRDGGTGDKKLTLLDSSRNGFTASVGGSVNATATSGGKIEIIYNNAETGTDEHVSAMLCDSDGDIIGYASAVADSDGADTWSLTLPSIADGTYTLKVLSEQQNGDKKTDYASPATGISFKVSDGKITMTKEYTPKAIFTATGPDSGKLSMLEAGAKYIVSGAGLGNTGEEITAGTDGTYEFASGLSAGILNIVKKSSSPLTLDSDPQTIEITKALKTTGIGKTDCTSSSNNDGTITGVDASMEYRKSGASGWTAITGSTVTNLTSGTYLVRTKAAEQALASESISLTIEEYKATPAPVKYPVTVNFGDGDKEYSEGDSVTITADAPGEGKLFQEWTGTEGLTFTYGNKDSATAIFTMPARAVTVTATYKDKKAEDPVITPPTAKKLTFTGEAQELVDPGTVKGGTMYYALGDESGATETYSKAVPKARDAGNYTVYYKVTGDDGYNNIPARGISVTIKKASDKTLSDITQKRNKGITGIEVPIDASIPKDAGVVSGYALDSEVSATGSVKINNAKVSPEGVVTADLSDGEDGDTITIPIKVTANNYDCTLSIIIALNNKKDPEFTAPKAKAGLVYDGTEQELVTKGSVTGEGEMQYVLDDEEGIYSTDLPTGKDALNYTVYYRIPESSTVNGVDPTPVNVAIARKAVKVKAEDKTKEKGSVDPSFTALIDGLVDGEKESLISFTLSREDGEEPGTYVITPSGDKEQGNYTVTYETGILTIEEKETPKPEKQSQELKFTESRVILKIGDEFTNTLSGAKTAVSFKSSDEAVASVGDDGKVTAVAEGTTTIMAEACETDEYYAGSAEFTITVEEKKEEKKEEEKDEPEKKPDKVPFTTEGEFYASTEDNFAAESGSGKITGLVLDFSRISESSVAPSDLKMTTISGSRFTTKAALKDKKSFKADKGIKVKVNKNTLIPAITVKKSGSVTLEMSDGNSFTIAFRAEKPKAVKKEKQQRQGSGQITKTISDLFGTSIDSGELTATGNAEVYGNSAIIDTAEKGSIKFRYKYLNKIYKMTVKVK